MSAVLTYLLVVFGSVLAAAFLSWPGGTFIAATAAAHLGMFHGML